MPYFFCWVFAAVPIFFLEVSLGQFLQRGGITVWKICPIFKGVGIANVLVSCFCNVYYNVIVAWALYYLFSSFTATFPWEECGNWWNDGACISLAHSNNATRLANISAQGLTAQTPVEQFWERRVLQTSAGIEENQGLQWELVGLLLLAWLIVYFALWKGITKARKFVYFCALSPYLLLSILFVRGMTLPGALEGVKYYLMPRLDALYSPTVWKDAGTQVFYSYGIGFGVLVSLGSYNAFNHNVYRDALMLCSVNVFTSLLAGFVVFSVLGFMAGNAGKTVAEVVKSGVGLAFLVYPEAVVALPVKQLWSVLFFLMIAILGMDSQVCTVEGVVTALSDQFPNYLRRGNRKKIFVAILCVANFLLALPMVTREGQYWLTLVDAYGASGIVLLFVVFFEVVGYAWGVGARTVYKALREMIGFEPCRFWSICWRFTAPAICVVLFFFVVLKYEPLTYGTGEAYPSWAQALGFCMSITSMLAVPAYALVYIARSDVEGGILAKIREGLKPAIQLPFDGIRAHHAKEMPTISMHSPQPEVLSPLNSTR